MSRPAVERGDVFRDRRTGIEREVRWVTTHLGGSELERPVVRLYCHDRGRGWSTVRMDRLLNRRLYERMWPAWKAIEDARAARA